MNAPKDILVVVDKRGYPLHFCRNEAAAHGWAASNNSLYPLDAPHTVHRYVLAEDES